jgi:hypothetical protein
MYAGPDSGIVSRERRSAPGTGLGIPCSLLIEFWSQSRERVQDGLRTAVPFRAPCRSRASASFACATPASLSSTTSKRPSSETPESRSWAHEPACRLLPDTIGGSLLHLQNGGSVMQNPLPSGGAIRIHITVATAREVSPGPLEMPGPHCVVPTSFLSLTHCWFIAARVHHSGASDQNCLSTLVTR